MTSGAKTSSTNEPAKSAASINWNADFAGLPPIELPDGRKLETLADCAAYILALPKSSRRAAWQRVTAQLLKAAEHGGGWPFLARVSFSNALHGVSGVVHHRSRGTSRLPGRQSDASGNREEPFVRDAINRRGRPLIQAYGVSMELSPGSRRGSCCAWLPANRRHQKAARFSTEQASFATAGPRPSRGD